MREPLTDLRRQLPGRPRTLGRLARVAWLLVAALTFTATACSTAADLGWSYPSAEPLRVHVVRGSAYYDREYRFEEILAHAGASLFTESTDTDRYASESGGGADAGWLRGQADPSGTVMDHQLVIVSNVSAQGFGKNQPVLVDFVRHGGSVLFLCGSDTFGGQSERSTFVEMAPLEFAAEGPWRIESEQVNEGVELKPGPDFAEKALPDVKPDNPPRVYSFCKVKPKPGAKVLLLAGDNQPILIVHEFEKGRVAVFTGSCRGYPKEGQLAFWRWSGWPGLLAETVRQLAATSREAPRGLGDAARRAAIDARSKACDLLDGVNERSRQQFEAVLHQVARRCHDRPTVDFLLDLVVKYPPGLPTGLAGTLGEAVCPWVDESHVPQAHALIESGDVGKLVLGLVVLGATRTADARATLEEFFVTGEPRKKPGTELSLVIDPGTVAATMRAAEDAEKIRRAALVGFGHLGDRGTLPFLRKVVATYAVKGRYQPDREATAIEPAQENYQNALITLLLCGDAEAAGPAVDSLLENLAVIPRIDVEKHDPRLAMVWQQQLVRRLPAVPDSVLPALAKRIGPEKNRNVVPVALAVFGGKKLSPEIAAALRESTVAAVAALGAEGSRGAGVEGWRGAGVEAGAEEPHYRRRLS